MPVSRHDKGNQSKSSRCISGSVVTFFDRSNSRCHVGRKSSFVLFFYSCEKQTNDLFVTHFSAQTAWNFVVFFFWTQTCHTLHVGFLGLKYTQHMLVFSRSTSLLVYTKCFNRNPVKYVKLSLHSHQACTRTFHFTLSHHSCANKHRVLCTVWSVLCFSFKKNAIQKNIYMSTYSTAYLTQYRY